MLCERLAKRAEKKHLDGLSSYQTDLLLIMNAEIKIIRPDINETYQWCVVLIYILVYT